MQTDISIFLAFGAGVLTFVSPCVFPLYPAFLSYITGLSVSDKTKLKSVEKESIIINLFSKRILSICHRIWVCKEFLIKPYFKETASAISLPHSGAVRGTASVYHISRATRNRSIEKERTAAKMLSASSNLSFVMLKNKRQKHD